MERKSILDQASELVNGDRARAYGDPIPAYEALAELWSVIVGKTVTARQVVLCLIEMKIQRQLTNNKRDNLVDIAGYAEILSRIECAECEQTGKYAGKDPAIESSEDLTPSKYLISKGICPVCGHNSRGTGGTCQKCGARL